MSYMPQYTTSSTKVKGGLQDNKAVNIFNEITLQANCSYKLFISIIIYHSTHAPAKHTAGRNARVFTVFTIRGRH